MIPPRSTVAADQQSERRRPERAWTRREYKGRKKPLHRLLIVSIAAVVLLAGGGIAAPSTVSVSALELMLPFFAVLAVASIGQHLVIQQRGLDLSTAGVMSFCAVVVTKLPDGSTDAGVVIFWIFAALAIGALIGAISGLIVTTLQ